ncbi:MAG TPA: hypothetical protein ENO03_00465 [Candidatus Aminicenantes bacterium]|nr:hypothetical protein [Candidatus Aminicenantes bacterium]
MMRKCVLAFLMACVLGAGSGLLAQLTEADQAEYEKWEEFLKTAEVIGQEQLTGALAVTNPWVLTLEKDGVQRKALWKDVLGDRIKGFKETWKGEIAAYRLSRALGVHMVPATVERRYQGARGSCQLWFDAWNNMEAIIKKDLRPPGIKALYNARNLCLQRAFDNLIYNVDRHQRNYLIMEDWRMILIDHSRSFSATKRARTDLIYDEKNRESSKFIMETLPRAFVDALRALTAESIREIVGEYLDDDEIAATLSRRDAIIAWLDKRIAELGEAKVLY